VRSARGEYFRVVAAVAATRNLTLIQEGEVD
jgi:hypothetical protein